MTEPAFPPDGGGEHRPLAPAAGSPAHVTRRGLALALAALLGVGAYAWYDLRRASDRLAVDAAQRLTAVEGTATTIKAREDQMAGELREALAKIALLEARISESQSQQAALEALYRDLAPSRDDLALNEVEQILLIANQHLGLAGNVPATIAALQLADQKLARVDRPALAPLRRSLSRDLDKLRALPYLDVYAVTARLDQALAQVDTLPLARDERLPAEKGEVPTSELPRWRQLLAEAWKELRNVIRIESSDRPAAELIRPSEAYFLRENLRMRLQSARVAILARQYAPFRNDLRAAQAWLAKYFDLRTKPVMAMRDTLNQLSALPVQDDLPDLAASLDAIGALKAAQERRPLPTPSIPARANR